MIYSRKIEDLHHQLAKVEAGAGSSTLHKEMTMNEKLKRLAAYAVARSQEASTWRGLTLIATGFGAIISPEKQEAIITAGVLLAGMLGAMLPDKGKRDVQ